MSFHFGARADSSDEDDAVDISNWTSGEKQRSHVNGFTPVNVQSDRQRASVPDDSKQSPEPSGWQDAPTHQRRLDSVSPPPPSFQAINKPIHPAPAAASALEADDIDSISLPDLSLVGGDDIAVRLELPREGHPAVVIYRNEVDTTGIEDMTGGGDVVRRIINEIDNDAEEVSYFVLFNDFSTKMVLFEQLLQFENGPEALEVFHASETAGDEGADERRGLPHKLSMKTMPSTRTARRSTQREGFVYTADYVEGDESEDELAGPPTQGRKRKHEDISQYLEEAATSSEDDEQEEAEDSDESSSNRSRAMRQRRRQKSSRHREASTDDDAFQILDSDVRRSRKRQARQSLRRPARRLASNLTDDDEDKRRGQRYSERSTRHVGAMQEVEIDDIYRSASDTPRVPAKPKPVGVREIFKILPRNDEFRMRHTQNCEVCGQSSNFAPLIDCQGCSLSYHKSCLGHRSGREHLVTKIDDGDFVLQCRRCIAVAMKKDHTAPDQGICQECRNPGAGCRPFRPRKTPAQEQKDREENDGVDPIYPVDPARIRNFENVLFRCTNCFRGFHYEHLPSRNDIIDIDMDVDAEQRFREYSRDWKCKDCLNMPAKVSGIVAWKPLDEDSYDAAAGLGGIGEDEKAYLVRWDNMSYFQARWMPGAWVWGVTAHSMRKAFSKRDDAQHPKMRTEDAIPEDYLRTDIVLDIKFTSIVDIQTEEVDKARIQEVDRALIKYKGLSYEDAVWEAPPSPEDGERWTDFVMAYNDWVAGRYVRQPKLSSLRSRLEKARGQDFQKLEKQDQPEKLEGGQLMKYQIEGVNWLYYKWFTQKNAILADEMGLGKTIQIIGFVATLVQDWNCYPFLIVVPNSTCPNWRREIKRWAPSLRVVAYYGTRDSRDAAYRYELYPEGSRDLRCHVVVTSYDTAADDSSRKFFKSVQWQGLIVDEGQRLKNNESQLYSALGALRAPFKILMTGTPLQNNQRELFNLLQFLDDTFDAAALEERYEVLDKEKINELHELIRPFFLRRTKAQVLTFLPPMAQIIIPVSMTIVQKKVYRSILAKNPELMRAIFSTEAGIKQGERGSLNNILMQLRRCLCHPFVYNKGIEDKHVTVAASHRNLVDASSKLKLLEILLPKLQQRGHRVLIFSQFLDMLDIVEDFLDGMTMRYQRLDGSVNSLTKQKRIDEFNAPNSELFAFLLSTRAGGVGINLATADTVIILDPDFNPHQDIQALSRAHRIGQSKKVLCFQLVTRASAEERIMQIGRKKLALDHVLIQEMDADDADENDLVSVLRHGANELFDSSEDQDILYDGANVDQLLDRSHMESTEAGNDKTAETQFSFARVWANDQGALKDTQAEAEEQAPDPGVWANILKERERIAAEEAAAKAESFGRGRRARAVVDYGADKPEGEVVDSMPNKKRKKRNSDESDTDFQDDDSAGDDDLGEGENELDPSELADIHGDGTKGRTGSKKNGKPSQQLPAPDISPERANGRKKALISSPVTKKAPKASALPVKKTRGAKGKDGKTSVSSRTSTKASSSKPVAKPRKRATDSIKANLEHSVTSNASQGGKASASSMKKSATDTQTGDEMGDRSGQSAYTPILIEDDTIENTS